jgi:methionyl-tRNA formyltransferase
MLSAAARQAARRCTLVRAQLAHRPPSVLLTGGSLGAAAAAPCAAAVAARGPRRAAASATSSAQPHNNEKHRVLFLGTPDVAADVLRELLRASAEPGATFRVVGVVTQPGKPRGRGNRAVPVPSPVEAAAAEAAAAYEAAGGASSGLPPPPVVLTPPNARDPAFYEALQALGEEKDAAAATATATPSTQPIDLAVTAAYGHILPQRFLDLPKHGTLNIHPSRLPQYRGAAPVPRAVEAGERVATVSLAYTVLACDAGPVLSTRETEVGTDEQAPELLARLFAEGARLLLEALPRVWSGEAARAARPQDENEATHAPKMSKEEGELAWGWAQGSRLHDKVRAFAGWPGTSGEFLVVAEEESSGGGGGGGDAAADRLQLKIVRTTLPSPEDGERASSAGADQSGGHRREVVFLDGGKRMLVPCGWEQEGSEGSSTTSWLEVLELQPPGKKAMAPRDFRNGLGKGKRLMVEAGTGYRGAPGKAPAAKRAVAA